jgi:hypothetical protein
MIRSRQICRVATSIVIAGVLCGPSHAALIAEIGINISPAFDASPPSTDSILYRFDVSTGLPPPDSGSWGRQVTASDLGADFEAAPLMVESFARALATPTADVTIRVNDTSFSRPLDQLQTGGWGITDGRATFNKFVPDITKVPVNRLTMTIDSFSFTRFGANASIGGGHTIRIYGIPEPTGWMLFSLALLGLNRRLRH